MYLVRKNAVLTLVLGGCLLGGVLPMRADWRDDCPQRIERAERRLHWAERRYGEHSPIAHERREQLERIRNRCRDYDHRDHHDHDHDHDHDYDRH